MSYCALGMRLLETTADLLLLPFPLHAKKTRPGLNREGGLIGQGEQTNANLLDDNHEVTRSVKVQLLRYGSLLNPWNFGLGKRIHFRPLQHA